ncbi:hypothetical protein SteCoe_20077 [Stentor coeruleus]|uniref:Uncharacterized protein n=1 Tax=Stentor coeruleus TaxID=5963 RepID=A0A1R2BSU9_9CILI|nr:hypothetical protein SteCoe_20077 [Stentor coeruleus]
MQFELIEGIVFMMKVPALWMIKGNERGEDMWYYLGWALFFIGTFNPRCKLLSNIIGVTSNILLLVTYASSELISHCAFILSMLCFGFSVGPFLYKPNYTFHSGSILGCAIGVLCGYYDWEFIGYTILISLSAMPIFIQYWIKNRRKSYKELLIIKNKLPLDIYTQYPPHKLGLVVVFLGFFFLSISQAIIFAIPHLILILQFIYTYYTQHLV